MHGRLEKDTFFYNIDYIGIFSRGKNLADKNILGIKYFAKYNNYEISIMPIFVNANIKYEAFGTDKLSS